MNEYDIIYQQNLLNSVSGLEITNHEFNTLPARQLALNKLARRNMSILTSAEYSQKEIRVWAEACGGSRAGTEQVINDLKQLVQPINGELRVMQYGVEVRYTCTLNEFNIEWDGTTALLELAFIATDPLGETVDLQTFGSSHIVGPATTLSGEFKGSGIVEPIINLTFNYENDSSQSISIFNANTNQGITLSRDWSNGDIIEINSETKRVYINGVLTDFTGTFPTFQAGTRTLGYSDTLSGRDIDLTVQYRAKYA